MTKLLPPGAPTLSLPALPLPGAGMLPGHGADGRSTLLTATRFWCG